MTHLKLLLLFVLEGIYSQIVQVVEECPTPFSTSSDLPFNEKCDCAGDWKGSFCTVCSSDESCEAAFGGSVNDPEGIYENHRCGRDFIVSMEQPVFHTWCNVDNEAILAQTNGPPFVDFMYDSLTGTGRLEFMRYLAGAKYEWVKLFTCGGTECSTNTNEDESEVQFTCENIECALTCEVDSTAECTQFFRITVAAIGIQVSENKKFAHKILDIGLH